MDHKIIANFIMFAAALGMLVAFALLCGNFEGKDISQREAKELFTYGLHTAWVCAIGLIGGFVLRKAAGNAKADAQNTEEIDREIEMLEKKKKLVELRKELGEEQQN